MDQKSAISVENKKDGFSEIWSRFSKTQNRDEYFHNWLALQSLLIPNIVSSVLVIGSPESKKSYEPVSKWPEKGGDPKQLADLLERVLEKRCGLLIELDNDSSSNFGLGYPVLVDLELFGSVAVEISARTEEELKYAMEQLQWGISWLELLFRRERSREEEAALGRLTSAVTLLAEAFAEDRFEGSAMAFVTKLATQLKCDRVSIGFVKKNRMRIQALSHSSKFGERMNLIRDIEKAMDEAVVQRREIIFPDYQDEKSAIIIRDHDLLSKGHGSGSILTIPLFGNDCYFGALTLERPHEFPFTEVDLEFCTGVISLAGPALEDKRKNDRHLFLKIKESLKNQIIRLTGTGYPGRKIFVTMLICLIVFFGYKNGDYRISADAVLEGEIRRIVAAPFNGFVEESSFRAGDIVNKNTVLCVLDDRDLRLERISLLSEKSQLKSKHQEALADHNRAEVNIINARIKQTDAELELVENQLARTLIKAPFKGILVSGDLSQKFGGPVQQGEMLFEIAPLDSYRIILKIDEKRISDIKENQSGTLLLFSFPEKHFNFKVSKITPITIAEEGQNSFRVEARIESDSTPLRPGMEGVGKIYVDRRKLIGIWTKDLREWFILWTWSWLP